MAITLFDLAWRIVVELGTARTGIATGGSTTTLIDTVGLRLTENDYYNEGTLFMLGTTDDAAPLKEYGRIKDFNNPSQTITLFEALTAVVTAADRYGVANRRFPLFLITEKINNALYMDGYIPGEDESITTVAQQREYTLPVQVSRDLRQVLVSTNDDSDSNNWVPVLNYTVQSTAVGTGNTLVLGYDLEPGRTLWLRYAKQHAELTGATSELDEVIHPDRIVYGVCHEMLRWYRDKTRLRHLDDTIKHLGLKSERARDLHPMPQLPSRSAKVQRFNRTFNFVG